MRRLLIAILVALLAFGGVAFAGQHHAKHHKAHHAVKRHKKHAKRHKKTKKAHKGAARQSLAADPVLLGDQNVAPNEDSNNSPYLQSFSYTATGSGTATDIWVYSTADTRSTTLQAALYSNSNGKPHTLLTHGTVAAQGAGWFDVPVPNAAITAGTTYWIAIGGKGSHTFFFRDTMGGSSSYFESSLKSTWATAGCNPCQSGPASAYVAGTGTTPPPTPGSTEPAVSGGTVQGDTLTTTNGTWSGSPTSYSYNWQQCDSTGSNCSSSYIAGATSSTYTTTAADVGHTIRSLVTATNTGGSDSRPSQPAGPITATTPPSPARVPVVQTAPSIAGTAEQGDGLTADHGTWTNNPTRYSYQWEDCSTSCSNIANATSSTYTLNSSDVGYRIKVVVIASNAGGNSQPATSAATTTVTAPLPPPPPSTGSCPTAMPGNTLTLGSHTYNLEGEDGFTKDQASGPQWSNSSNPDAVVYTGDHGMGWAEYPDGWATTNGGTYQPSTVQSVHDGMLDFSLSGQHGANPSPLPAGNRYQTYGAYSFCEKVVPDPGSDLGDYYQASLLWPQNDSDWQSAESDFPEDGLAEPQFEAFAHYGGSGSQDSFSTGTIDKGQWHVFTQAWGPGFRSYYMDGKLLGTSTNQVWSSPERWQLQIETTGTHDNGTGHVYIDWAWIGTLATAPAPPPQNVTLTAAKAGNGSGTVSGGSINCGPTCSESIPSGTSQTLTATPAAGSTFAGWSGGGCSGTGPCTVSPTADTTMTATFTANPSPAGKIQHVVWIFMENWGYSDIIGSSQAPYINSLANTYGLATNYTAVDHPSLPNYIAATSGQSCSVCEDDGDPSAHTFSYASIFSQLPGGQSRSLEESMPSNCDQNDSGEYAVRHDPEAYYTNLGTDCQNYDVPLGPTPDLSARFTFITPNLIDDMHDSSISAGDSFLQSFVPKLMATSQYQAGNTALFITWDEDGSQDSGSNQSPPNRVPLIVISPYTNHVQNATAMTHYSLLGETEDLLGLPHLGQANSAMNGKFGF